MNRRAFLATTSLALCTPASARETVVGLPCEGCELVFVDMPAAMGATARIAPKGEPGEPLVIEGVVRRSDAKPAAGIIVYAYHTDAGGLYPRASVRHGRLRAWARTGDDGRYRFETIRPGAYPGTDIPQHVHMHVIEPGKSTYYIDDIEFDDDPLLTPAKRERRDGRGGRGVCRPERVGATWRVQRDIVLGKSVPGWQ